MLQRTIVKTISKFKRAKGKYLTPNKYAQSTGVTVAHNFVSVTGYQQFSIDMNTKQLLPTGTNAQHKFNILNYFFRVNMPNARFLDIGSNNGMFVFLASLYGAKSAFGYDLDPEYVTTAQKVQEYVQLDGVRFYQENMNNIQEPADFLLFLSMIHWVYNKTEEYGSLDAVIEKLAALTNKCLIIEWVSEQDHKIVRDQHIAYNQEVIKEPYDFVHFDAALKMHFKSYELLGVNTPTRLVYAAWK
jgi:SAM-dependent methyltransferase